MLLAKKVFSLTLFSPKLQFSCLSACLSCWILQNLHHGYNWLLTKIQLSRSAANYKRSAIQNCQNILPVRQTDPSLIELEILTSIDKLTSPDEVTSAVISLHSPAHTFQCHHWVDLRNFTLQAFQQTNLNWNFLVVFFKVNIDWRWSDSAAAATEPFPPLFGPRLLELFNSKSFKANFKTIPNNLLLQTSIQNH